jgi:16S rRNA U516 pseudouridylate synthase RsuA-like enzyme
MEREQGHGGSQLPARWVSAVCEILVNQRVCSHSEALELVDTGGISIPNRLIPESRPVVLSTSDVIIHGHPLSEVTKTHHVIHKPAGVSGSLVGSARGLFRGLLPFPLMHIGWSSAIERSTSGLHLLLNDVSLGKQIANHPFERRYSVQLDQAKPLSPSQVQKLLSSIPFSKFTLIPHTMDSSLLPLYSPVGSAFEFTVLTTDQRPHVVRTIFSSVGMKIRSIRLDALAELSLENLGISNPGSVRNVCPEEIRAILRI